MTHETCLDLIIGWGGSNRGGKGVAGAVRAVYTYMACRDLQAMCCRALLALLQHGPVFTLDPLLGCATLEHEPCSSLL